MSNCPYDNIKIGQCDNTASSDPIILSYDNIDINQKKLTITIDTSRVYES